MLDRIIKLTPLAGTLLIFSGVLKLIFFYSYFNIRIIDYLEFQEIVTSFLGDVNIIVVFVMIMTLITFVTLNFIKRKTKLPTNDLLKKLLILLYPKRIKYAIFFLVAILIAIGLIRFRIIGYNYFVIYLLTFFSVQMLTYLFLHKEENGEVDIPNFYGLIILGISLSVSLYLFAQHDIEKIKLNDSETTIVFEKNTIHCNAKTKNLYIGKTSKFVFIKLDSLNSTIVIPTEVVKQYEFK